MTAHSGLIIDYLGSGTHAARPASPNIASGVLAVYYETDTGNTFAWSGSTWVQLNGTGGTSPLPQSALFNGGGDVFQRQVASTDTARTDGSYGPDRWYVLTQTAAVNVKQTAGDTDSVNAMRLTQNQASAQRMGLAQVLEQVDTLPLRGRTVTLSVRVKISNSQAVRAAILEWTGTADSPTKDVVNDWTSGTYTVGNFFLGSNLAVTAITSATPGAAAWTTITLTATIGSSANNLYVFVWTEGTAATGLTFDLTQCGLYNGSTDPGWLPRQITDELQRCQRYFERMDTGGGFGSFGFGFELTTTTARIGISYARKRVAPTVTFGTASNFVVADKTTNTVCSSLAAAASNKTAGWFTATVASGLIAGNGCLFADNNNTNAFIDVEAELGA